MCIFQISGNSLLLALQLNISTISFKQNCKIKIIKLGDMSSTEFDPDSLLLNSLKILHCETKGSDNYFPGKICSLGTFKGSLSISYIDAKNR